MPVEVLPAEYLVHELLWSIAEFDTILCGYIGQYVWKMFIHFCYLGGRRLAITSMDTYFNKGDKSPAPELDNEAYKEMVILNGHCAGYACKVWNTFHLLL